MIKTTKGYKFIKKNMKSRNGKGSKWRKNIWKKCKGELEMCSSGYHACLTPLQSLEYVYGNRWFLVESKGKILKEKDDKFVAEEMRLIKELPVKPILVEFAIRCAERCIKNFEKYNKEDKRPRLAIIAAKNYIENPCKKTQSAARSAAWSAARSAESAARSAARSAAWSAAWSARSAARSAAWSAAWSARSAAWSAAESAEIKWQERILKKIVTRYENET